MAKVRYIIEKRKHSIENNAKKTRDTEITGLSQLTNYGVK